MKNIIKALISLVIIAALVVGVMIEKTIPASIVAEKITNISTIVVLRDSDFTKEGLKNLPVKVEQSYKKVTKTNVLGAETETTSCEYYAIVAKVGDKKAEFIVTTKNSDTDSVMTITTDYEKYYKQAADEEEPTELEESEFYAGLEFLYSMLLDADYDSDKKVYYAPETEVLTDGEITRVSSKALSLIGYAESTGVEATYTCSLFGDKITGYKIVRSSNLGETISSVTTTEVRIVPANFISKLLVK